MSDLLECLTSSIPTADEAASRLKKYLEQIDKHIQKDQSMHSSVSVRAASFNEQLQSSTAEIPFPLDFLEQMAWPEATAQSFEQE
jgi:hypothetical protein